jgi:methionyl-tRNA formyltransferase
MINAHASLLPKYRGAAPIVRAILAGELHSGISVMRVEREMDAGPVALSRKLAIGADENAGQLGERLARLAAQTVAECVEQISESRVEWTEQEHECATLAPKLERGEAKLDWHEEAAALVRRIRAFAPKPGAFSTLDGVPLRILAARSEPGAPSDEPGTVRKGEHQTLRIATGGGWLVPSCLQRAGGRPLDVAAFLRGRPIPDGALLGA